MQTDFYPGNENNKTDNNKRDLKSQVNSSPFYNNFIKKDFTENTDEKLYYLINTDPREERTSGGFILYSLNSTNESTTSISPEAYQMYKDFRNILSNCSTEELNDEPSSLIVETKSWLEKFGKNAVDLLKMYMNSTYPNNYLLSEIMEMLGDVNSQASYEKRRNLLEENIRSTIPELRYGAVLGLANMDSKESISILMEVLRFEKISLISNTIKAAIKQFKNEK